MVGGEPPVFFAGETPAGVLAAGALPRDETLAGCGARATPCAGFRDAGDLVTGALFEGAAVSGPFAGDAAFDVPTVTVVAGPAAVVAPP
jgi:hypothetical protein